MENPIIKISTGEIKGTTDTNIDGEQFYCFYGIPYGKPPVGDLRFKAPLPAESWSGIRDVTKEGPPCYQKSMFAPTGGYEGSEDCLHLNVFTKSLPDEEKKKKPVLFYIHGGAFVLGSNNTMMQGPGRLMTEDVVLVYINYRVGVLGFLSLEDPSLEIPGNAGLKDQTLALKWVKDNIEYFNGDPDNVTIFGVSAGSASVHFQILSPTSKGLFHKAIMQSGSALNPWAYSIKEANEFVKYLGKKPDNDKELYETLKNATVNDLVEAQDKYMKEIGTFLGIFAPVIEAPNRTAFLDRPPIELITTKEYNHVPMILGYTSEEGLLLDMLSNDIQDIMQGKKLKSAVIKVEDFVPREMELQKGGTNWKKVVKIFDQFYNGGKYKNNKYKIATDALFAAGIIAATRNHARTTNNPIYLYRMSIVAGCNMVSKMLKLGDSNLGAAHGDDIGYIFDNKMMPSKFEKGSVEEMAVRRFVKLWTDFARYSDPTYDEKMFNIKWPSFRDEEGEMKFLDIDKELSVHEDPEGDRMKIWKEVYMLSPHTELFL